MNATERNCMQELEKYRYQAVNLSLVLIEGVVFLLCMIPSSTLYERGLHNAYLVMNGEYWRLITSIFLHSGLQHLGSNLLAQGLLGGAVERNIGHVRYLLLFLISGICGNILSAACDIATGSNTYSVGASGAVFGVMGCLIVIVIRGRNQIRKGSSLMVRAGLAVFYAVFSGFATPYTDNAAHIGGLAAGLVLGALFMMGRQTVDLQDLR